MVGEEYDEGVKWGGVWSGVERSVDVTCFEAQLKLMVITMLLAQLPRPARFRPHEAALNNANQSRSSETALSFITEARKERHCRTGGQTDRKQK